MATDSTRSSFHSFQAQAELELLQLILNDEQPYPWNPAEAGAEAYFAELEQAVAAEWLPEELAVQGQALATQLDQMWAALPTVPVNALRADLLRRFEAQVPRQLLEGIVQRAQQVLATKLSLADRMVQCVQEFVPAWGEEDLLVLARPYAYAMRHGRTESLDSMLQSVSCAAWTELSSVEQARLSLVIARYAIAHLPPSEHQP